MADNFSILRRIHLFISLTDDEVRELATHFVSEELPANEYVFMQGDPAQSFYIIQSGQVEVEQGNPDSGQTQRITILVPGDYFGEMGLVRHGNRSASVKALDKPITLLKLTTQEFEEYVLTNPKVKPHLEVAIRSRQYARRGSFRKWLAPNEIVYLVTLRHQIFLLEMMWKPAAVMVAALIVAGLIYWYNLELTWHIISLLVSLIGIGWAIWNWVDFHNDWYVVTNQRVVDIDKVVLFYESRAEAPIGTVQNTSTKSNEIGRILNFGDVIVNTWSGPVIFHNVPFPQATADMILEQVHRARVQQKVAEREQLKKMLRENVGIQPVPVKAASSGGAPTMPGIVRASANAGMGSWMTAARDFLSVREQRGDTITYHKHPIVLAQEVAGSMAGLALLIAAIIARIAGSFDFLDIWVFSGLALFIFLILFIHLAYEYLDWKNDIYMITGSQIMDISRKPLGEEQRKAANLDAITNISFIRPGLLYQLFNYGTVTINAGPGGDLHFYDVFDPVSVQQDIYRRKEAQAAAKSQSATKQRVDELGQYMAAFYEVMEDERIKREGSQEKK